MLTYHETLIDQFIAELRQAYLVGYGRLNGDILEVVTWMTRLTLNHLAITDALYHNIHHTMLVTSVGTLLLQGKHMQEGSIEPNDWLHVLVALLCHDIGYVRGICRSDDDRIVATGVGTELILLTNDRTDASLMPYHVDRAKLFVRERFGGQTLYGIDAELVAEYIESTRFPRPNTEDYLDTSGYHGLVRAADAIGQLGDPDYLRKIPALYYEFAENEEFQHYRYTSPGDMRRGYARFYWDEVSPYIQDAMHYLRITSEGRRWIATLHSHVFDSEHQQCGAA